MNTEKTPIPTIPTTFVKHNGKEYKWMVPQFKLPGSKQTLISSDVSDDKIIIEKILDIEGQGLLIEQY